MIVTALLVLAAGTYVLKALGPVVLGDGGLRAASELPAPVARAAQLLPAPLLAALVATSTFVADQRWALDARAVGLAAAAIGLWFRLPFVAVVALAAAATALTRAVAP